MLLELELVSRVTSLWTVSASESTIGVSCAAFPSFDIMVDILAKFPSYDILADFPSVDILAEFPSVDILDDFPYVDILADFPPNGLLAID